MSYKVIFDHKNFFVISKNPGIEFHGDNGIVTILRQDFDEVYGIHRLDKNTSGLMIFAKNKEYQTKLSKLFSDKHVEKIYCALSDKRPKKKQGLIKGDLLKSRDGNYKLAKTFDNPSSTRFYSFFAEENQLRVFLVYPMTGKTHQIRVVLKSIASPILGDKRYKGTTSDRMYLHAIQLSFNLDDEEYKFRDIPQIGELYIQNSDFIEDHLDSVKW